MLIGGLFAAGLFVAACGSDDDAAPAAAPAPISTDAAPAAAEPAAGIQIIDFGFAGDLVAEPGQTVQVVNDDGAPHTVTAVDGSFDTGTIDGGTGGAFVAPDAEGVYAFFCAIHSSMTGELTVSA